MTADKPLRFQDLLLNTHCLIHDASDTPIGMCLWVDWDRKYVVHIHADSDPLLSTDDSLPQVPLVNLLRRSSIKRITFHHEEGEYLLPDQLECIERIEKRGWVFTGNIPNPTHKGQKSICPSYSILVHTEVGNLHGAPLDTKSFTRAKRLYKDMTFAEMAGVTDSNTRRAYQRVRDAREESLDAN